MTKEMTNAKAFNAMRKNICIELRTLNALCESIYDFDDDTDEEVILYEADRLEAIISDQATRICERLRNFMTDHYGVCFEDVTEVCNAE